MVLVLCNCQTKNNNDIKGLTIQIREENFEKGKTKLSSLIKVTELIPLETNKDCLIGRIDKVIISKNRIYVLDRRRAKSVFIFDRQGKFVNKIAPNGKGPMDITVPSDIGIHPLTNDLVILDFSLKKINSYNQDGYFLGTKTLKFGPSHFEFLSSNRIAFSALGPYQVYITDLEGNIVNTYFKHDQNFVNVLIKPLFTYNNELYFLRFLDDNIYKITENQLLPEILIDFGQHTITREDYLKLPIIGMDRQIGQESINGIYIPGINQTHFVFLFTLKGKAYYNIYNRIDGRLLTLAYLDIKDDLFFGGADIIFINNSFDEHFIGEIEPNRMKPLTPIFDKQIKYEVAIDDNPVLFLYDIKK
ncbi:MAG: 6-bladed beta-propeller [Porphyromonadaceae bacterium]|nr:MAG: 6-bladed beta-propeller [Porphyromonadaceae bacterium]